MPWTPEPPAGNLSKVEVALWHVREALQDRSNPPRLSDAQLIGQLNVDRGEMVLTVPPYTRTPYYRPWETSARLIEQGGDYEVQGELRSVTDRKIQSLRRTQQQRDAANGYVGLVDEYGQPLQGDADGFRITWGR